MKTVIAFALLALCFIATQTTVSAQQPCPVMCQFGANHRFPHFTQCNRYYECQSGFLFEFNCGDRGVFDVETLQCRTDGTGRCVLTQNVRAVPLAKK